MDPKSEQPEMAPQTFTDDSVGVYAPSLIYIPPSTAKLTLYGAMAEYNKNWDKYWTWNDEIFPMSATLMKPPKTETRTPRRLFEDEMPADSWVYVVRYRVHLKNSGIDGSDRWSDWGRWVEPRILFRRKKSAELRIQGIRTRGRFGDPAAYEFRAEPSYLGEKYRDWVQTRWKSRRIQRAARKELMESSRQRALDEARMPYRPWELYPVNPPCSVPGKGKAGIVSPPPPPAAAPP